MFEKGEDCAVGARARNEADAERECVCNHTLMCNSDAACGGILPPPT